MAFLVRPPMPHEGSQPPLLLPPPPPLPSLRGLRTEWAGRGRGGQGPFVYLEEGHERGDGVVGGGEVARAHRGGAHEAHAGGEGGEGHAVGVPL
mgnify:CR=1 FL=1